MLKKIYINYIEFAIKKPIILILITILFLLFSYPILNIHFDNNGKGWYTKKSERLELKNQFVKDFGSDEMMIYLLTFPDSLSFDRRQELLYSLTDTVRKTIYSFENVFSRSNIYDIKSIMGEDYAQKMDSAYFQSNDSLCEIMFLKVRLMDNILKVRPLIVDSLEKLTKAVLPNYVRCDLTGQSIVYSEINRLSSGDSLKLFAICFVFICGLLFWQVRKLKYIVISLFLLILSVISSLSLFGWLDIPINMITITVPLLFIINFSSFVIHIITKQSSDMESYLNRKLPPIITSALATIIGFGSLVTNNIHIITQYGILTSIGIIVGLLTLLLVGVPLVIKFIEINELVTKSNWLNRILDKFYLRINKKISYWILAIISVVFVSSIIVSFTIKVDTNMVNIMKKSNKQRQSIEYFGQHFGSANVIDY